MLNEAPPLGTLLEVTAAGHQDFGKSGPLTGYHGVLTDMVYVLVDGADTLLCLAYLSKRPTDG